MIALTLKYYQDLKKDNLKRNGSFEFPVVVMYLLLIVILILGVYLPIVSMVIIAASRVDNAVHSISNVYFIVSVVFLVISIFSLGMKQAKVSEKRENHHTSQKMSTQELRIFMFKPYLIMIITFVIVSTNFYTASLIVIAIAKACIDVVSFFKKQQKTVNPQGLSQRL
jgi:hypothetical protein